jgi:hypothetical protein
VGTGTTRCSLLNASGKHLTVNATPSPSSEGTQRDEPAQVGRVYPKVGPNHPAARRSGMRMWFETPEQRHIRVKYRVLYSPNQAGEDTSLNTA